MLPQQTTQTPGNAAPVEDVSAATSANGADVFGGIIREGMQQGLSIAIPTGMETEVPPLDATSQLPPLPLSAKKDQIYDLYVGTRDKWMAAEGCKIGLLLGVKHTSTHALKQIEKCLDHSRSQHESFLEYLKLQQEEERKERDRRATEAKAQLEEDRKERDRRAAAEGAFFAQLLERSGTGQSKTKWSRMRRVRRVFAS